MAVEMALRVRIPGGFLTIGTRGGGGVSRGVSGCGGALRSGSGSSSLSISALSTTHWFTRVAFSTERYGCGGAIPGAIVCGLAGSFSTIVSIVTKSSPFPISWNVKSFQIRDFPGSFVTLGGITRFSDKLNNWVSESNERSVVTKVWLSVVFEYALGSVRTRRRATGFKSQ